MSLNINLLNHPICFINPLRVTAASAWHEHIPFAMFLVDLVKPNVIVELGTHHGDSYLSFCQAVSDLNLTTRCYAVDTWKGDPHSGFYDPDVLADLQDHHDRFYGNFSRLIKSTFDEALQHFSDGTIDLLHIDGYHTYESVKQDFESWLPKMSQSGVILFHDINVRENDFGVWRLWEEVKSQYPSFFFSHGHGLGVLAIGKGYPKAFEELLDAEGEDLIKIQNFFFKLGHSLTMNVKLHQLTQETTDLQVAMKDMLQIIDDKQQIIDDKQQIIDEMEHHLAELNRFWLAANSSLGWRLIAKCHELEEKYMPSGTLRRSIYDFFWNSLKSMVSNLQNYLTNKAEKNKMIFKEDRYLNNNNAAIEDNCILVIDRFVPTYDKDSGSLRMFSILGILTEIGYKVTFLGDVRTKKKSGPYLKELKQMGIEVLDGAVDVEKYLVKMGHIFTFVIISRPEMAFKYSPLIRAYAINSTIIYDMVDLHWLRLERAASVTGEEEFLNGARHYKSMELYNAACSDTVFTVSEDEKELLLKESPMLNIEVVPNIHNIIKIDNPFRKRKDIMFIGGFHHQPNVDAVLYFTREIFPMITEKMEDLNFFVVGSDPPNSIRKLNSEKITVTGYIKDVTPYFKNCRVFVSPLRFGSGIKGKIGQSMAHGLPVVTTRLGAEGMRLLNEENALIADDPKKFSDAVIRLYTDELLWNEISVRSIEHIERCYTKEIISKRLAKIFSSIKQQKHRDEVVSESRRKLESR